MEFLFALLMVMIFGRLAVFAVRMAWGFTRVLVTLILLPGILILAVLRGLFSLAFPLLVIVGVLSLLFPKR